MKSRSHPHLLISLKNTRSKKSCTRVKLQKLVTIKFQGTQLDRLQFWSQYKTEIDKSIVSAVGKISYWKELLNPKVRAPADGLSFTTAEGCNRAKNILTTKFGNEYLVVNARVKTISLRTINHYHQEKIHEFYEKWPSYVKINKWVCKKHSVI